MSQPAMLILVLAVITILPSTIRGTLQITDHEYPLMHYTKLKSEEHFTAGRTIVLVLPIVEEDSTNEEVGYLIKELNISSR
jgi:hypothetical protein